MSNTDGQGEHPNKVSVLFSEPKIPQFAYFTWAQVASLQVSVLFSEPKIPQYYCACSCPPPTARFQCSSASRKFLNLALGLANVGGSASFSALQRAENSSIMQSLSVPGAHTTRFSALQRAENSSIEPVHTHLRSAQRGFSALQRAENSSISRSGETFGTGFYGFSALQRAENSSIDGKDRRARGLYAFQCSSASRKFLNKLWLERSVIPALVSVLFSEPKIPQFGIRNDSPTRACVRFQCSSASRKFLNSANARRSSARAAVSVLFSEPKIPQC